MSDSSDDHEKQNLIPPSPCSGDESEISSRDIAYSVNTHNPSRPRSRKINIMAALGWVGMRRGPRSVARVLGLVVAFMICAVLVESYFLGLWPSHSTKRPSDHPKAPSKSPLEKPRGYKIIGLIFYGRRDRAAILDCYLKENLAINGGWLDEVVWGVNTDNTDDLVYLEELVPTSPYYRRLDLEEKGFVNLWNQSVESGNIYVKIDDDVVYISPDAIPLIVHTLTTQEKAVVVSANVINSPEHNWIHYRTGAVQPYLPEFDVPAAGSLSTLENPVWRVADFPSWIGPPGWASPAVGEFTDTIAKLLPPRPDGQHSTELPLHRWLPLDDSGDIYKTPIAQTSYAPYGAGWASWAIAAQQHYSFFRNLELGRLSAYHMMHGEGRQLSALWDHTGDRLSINMLAVRGDVVLDNIDTMATAESDEAYLSVDLPRQLSKRLLVHTQALASHYAFRTQETLGSTDVLSRYRAYADRNVCRGGLITPEWR